MEWQTYPLGYISCHISGALARLELYISESKIRRCANENNLFLRYRTKKGRNIHLIPEEKLETLVELLKVPVRINDLYDALQETD